MIPSSQGKFNGWFNPLLILPRQYLKAAYRQLASKPNFGKMHKFRNILDSFKKELVSLSGGEFEVKR